MAITFENNNSNNSRTIIIILFIIAILLVAGFLVWKMSSGAATLTPAPQPVTERINDKILTDARVGSLELFPQIPPSTVPAGKKNPFVESATSTYSASTSTAANVLEPGGMVLPQLVK